MKANYYRNEKGWRGYTIHQRERLTPKEQRANYLGRKYGWVKDFVIFLAIIAFAATFAIGAVLQASK